MMRTESQTSISLVEHTDEQCCHGLDDDHHSVLAQDLADVTRMYTKKMNTSHEDVNEAAEASETMDNTVTVNRTIKDAVDSDNGSKDHDRDEHPQSQTRPMETRVPATTVLLEVTDGSNSEAAMRATEAVALVTSPVPKPKVIPAENLDLINDVHVDHQDVKNDTDDEIDARGENIESDESDETVENRNEDIEHGASRIWNSRALHRPQELQYRRG
ncbi:hypothetical protein DVH05_002784 [Phytophthora capsici]|nr:hypothetical protein DVH05_002784 [Phytophthora capsici]